MWDVSGLETANKCMSRSMSLHKIDKKLQKRIYQCQVIDLTEREISLKL